MPPRPAHPEYAARDGGLRIGSQRFLCGGFLGAGHERDGVEAFGVHHFGDDRRVAHIVAILPHRGIGGIDEARQVAVGLHHHRHTHQGERVDGKVRVQAEAVETVRRDEALKLELLIGPFGGDFGIGHNRRAIVRRLEHAADEDRRQNQLRARALDEGGQHLPREIAVGRAEIEKEFQSFGHQKLSVQGRRSSSCVHALRFWLCSMT